MKLVRLEPGQLWHVVWTDNDPSNHPPTRSYLYLLLGWDPIDRMWSCIRTYENKRMRIYKSASFFQDLVIDTERNSDSYRMERWA